LAENGEPLADLLLRALPYTELPCLRFFLRSEAEIRRAYVPELKDWSAK
jgi:hypothetical protein